MARPLLELASSAAVPFVWDLTQAGLFGSSGAESKGGGGSSSSAGSCGLALAADTQAEAELWVRALRQAMSGNLVMEFKAAAE